jgi:hypothetical protein
MTTEWITSGIVIKNLMLTGLRHFSSHRPRLTRHSPITALTDTNHTIDRNFNTRGIASRITQQIHVSTAQPFSLSQPRRIAIILKLLLPMRLLKLPIRHSRLDEPLQDIVDTGVTLRPLHSECVYVIFRTPVFDAPYGAEGTR